MKDLEWLRQEVEKYERAANQHESDYRSGFVEAIKKIMGLIDQVEQPTLSKEWIDTFSTNAKNIKELADDEDRFVPVREPSRFVVEQPEITHEQALDKLAEKYPFSSASIGAILEGHAQQGKYEQPELPAVPQYVADYIEQEQSIASHWFEAMDQLLGTKGHDFKNDEEKKVAEYVLKHPDYFVDAYRYGYTVEESKHEVAFNMKTYKVNLIRYKGTNDWGFANSSEELYNDHLFTEKEIKDFDPRYMAFAVPVDEEE